MSLNLRPGKYRMRNGRIATVTLIERVPCKQKNGRPGHILLAWGKDDWDNMHMWSVATGQRAPSRRRQKKPNDIVEKF